MASERTKGKKQGQGRQLCASQSCDIEEAGSVASLLELDIVRCRQSCQVLAESSCDLLRSCNGLADGEKHGQGQEKLWTRHYQPSLLSDGLNVWVNGQRQVGRAFVSRESRRQRRPRLRRTGTLTSFHVSLRSMRYLLTRTVKTERHVVTIAIQATTLTMGPLLLGDISGVRPTRPCLVAMPARWS